MRVVIQKVKEASVIVEKETIASIKKGYLILAGVEDSDENEDVDWLSKKIIGLRIFEDENDIMNKSIMDVNGEIIVVSQFTLFAKTKKGNRPSYIRAAKHEKATYCYERLIKQLSLAQNKNVQHGKFGAMMDVKLINDGPTTIIMDTKNKE